jgi:hypothetical protein
MRKTNAKNVILYAKLVNFMINFAQVAIMGIYAEELALKIALAMNFIPLL